MNHYKALGYKLVFFSVMIFVVYKISIKNT